jgi:hypothetical protein
MNNPSGSGTVQGLLAAAGIGILAGIIAAGAWMLAFTQLGIVPTGTDYPDNWKLLTSTAQVDWLREHMVVVSGFTAVEHMVTHFSEYSNRIYMHFANSVFTGLLAALLYWYVRRDHA